MARYVLILCAVAMGLVAGVSRAGYSPDNPIVVRLQPVAAGLDASVDGVDQRFPTELVAFPDGSSRLLVATLGGVVRLIDAGGALQAAPYLDTTSSATITADTFGMTALAFHPDFAAPGTPGYGRFYTVETELTQVSPPPDFPDPTPDFPDVTQAHDRVLYEYTQSDIAANTFAGAKREVVRIHLHRRDHAVNDLVFDANAYLYISSGESVVAAHGQDLSNVLGKILRIDPVAPQDNPASVNPLSANGRYRVPLSNPFLGEPSALDEIYAYGLRNPFRISFDGPSGQLICSSNGSDFRETVYHVDGGDNLGWPIYEGTLQVGTPPPDFMFRPPVFEYDQGLGRSVNGVFVYRGATVAALTGMTVFADFRGPDGGNGARLFYGDPVSGEFSDVLPDPVGVPMELTIVSVGKDAAGELYLLSREGTIVRVAESPDADADGVPQELDNCTNAANPAQVDADADGFGNACDADLNNDCSTNSIDLGLLKAVFFSADAGADLNSDGVVNTLDLGIFKALFFAAPGPSGIASCP